MITHIVQWRVKENAAGLSREEILEEMRQRLEGLNGKIPEIITLSVGVNERPGDHASDIVLMSTFSDWEALKTYADHPDHQAVVAFVGKVVSERRVVDFES
ncbi:MAG: Dabb family protein [Verrucomicrobia bacterium]|nr:Dabb family protein [Verrucomicrobiota bacterium]MCH8514282.1 Dabb family protein [Kiritimatiellia bacterium]